MVGTRSNPDDLGLVSVELQTTRLAPRVDVVCAARQTTAQCVSVVRSAAAVAKLSVIGLQVTL